MVRSRRSRLTIWATAGFMLLQIGWLILMAPFAGIDEFDHAYRAGSVANGHVFIDNHNQVVNRDLVRGDLIPVRRDIVVAANPACINLPYTRMYDCWPAKDLHNGEVLVASSASNYNPTYYLIAGIVAKPFHGDAALYAMRTVSALICAALFALAVHLTTVWARTIWPTVAVILVALPTTIYSSTLAAPNGIEMLSGIALWATLLYRFKADQAGLPTYVAVAALAASLVNMHTLGILWLGLILAAVATLFGAKALLVRLWPKTFVELLIALSATVAIAFEFVWLAVARPNDPSGPVVVHTSAWAQLPSEMLLWPLQAIGAYPFRDERAPLLTYAATIVVLVGTLALVARRLRDVPRLRLTLSFVVLMSYAVPVALTVATYSRLGLNWQGRYGMPFTAGFFLLIGLALDRSEPPVRKALVEIGIFVWVFADVVSQISVLDRQAGDPVLARTGWWAPPGILIVAFSVGAWLAWRRALIGRGNSHRGRTTGRRAHAEAESAADPAYLEAAP